nr:hypothetical protein [Tanacetum cinerariifolium]
MKHWLFQGKRQLKKNDVVRLQALIDRRKVIITEDTIRQALQLDEADSIDCLPNEEIFTELARMRYKKPSTKMTFYKAFLSAQWKFLIHTILQLHDDVADVVVDANAEPTPSSLTPATTSATQQELVPSSSQVESTPPPSPHHSTIT